jgi:ABC-type transport system substrate-binding protein
MGWKNKIPKIKKVSRPAVTKLQGAIVAIIIFIIALIVGYYAILPAPTQTPSPTSTPAPTQIPSKTFVNLQQYDFLTDLDPAYSFSGEVIVMANVYETLLRYTGGTP